MLAGLIGSAAGCDHKPRSPDAPSEKEAGEDLHASATGLERLLLDDYELAKLQREALDGDPTAARRVADHYVGMSVSEPDRLQDFKQWNAIGAQNGDVYSMVNLAEELLTEGGENNCRRAAFWVRRAGELASDNDARDYASAMAKRLQARDKDCKQKVDP